MPSDAKTGFRNELLAVMWRWSQESELTNREFLEACHEAIEKIILAPSEKKTQEQEE